MSELEVRSILSSVFCNDNKCTDIPNSILLGYSSSEIAEFLNYMSGRNNSYLYNLTLNLRDTDLDKFYKLIMLVECTPRWIEASLSIYTPSLDSNLIESYILDDKFYCRSVREAVEDYLKPEWKVVNYDETDKFKTISHVTRDELKGLTDSVWNYSIRETKFPSWNNVLFYKKQYDSNDLPVVMRRLY